MIMYNTLKGMMHIYKVVYVISIYNLFVILRLIMPLFSASDETRQSYTWPINEIYLD